MKLAPIEGHRLKVEPTESGRRFHARCSCGYGYPRWPGETPPTSATETVAMTHCINHWRWVVAEFRRVGAEPPFVTADVGSARTA